VRLPNWLSRAPKSDPPAAFLGRWKRVRADQPDGDAGVTMEFTADGRLHYIIDTGTSEQVMLLTYHIDGNELVTDQPSRSRIERTRFVFETPDILLLDFEGERTWFERISLAGGA